MKNQENRRIKRINIGLTYKEFEKLKNSCNKTTCHTVSEYARSCLFSKSITILTRNVSIDEAVFQLGKLNEELNKITKKIGLFIGKINSEGIETSETISLVNNHAERICNKIDETKKQLKKFANKWL